MPERDPPTPEARSPDARTPDASSPEALARYRRCEAVVIRLEGAYVDNPCDKGGPTKWGVTERALAAWRGRACTPAEVATLTPAQAAQIYRGAYWGAVNGDALPAGIDLITFDAAVNCGRGRAVGFLQTGLGLAVDGAFGPATVRALQACAEPAAVIARIRLARGGYYARLQHFDVFGRGWLARLESVSRLAQSWASAQPPRRPPASPAPAPATPSA